MTFAELVAARRSIRKFKPDPVPDATLTGILNAARLAPSGTNVQPWAFLVVRSAARRDALQEASFGQTMLAQAPAVLVCCGDRSRYKKRLRRGRELVEIGAVDASVGERARKVYKERDGKDAADMAITKNCMIAAEHAVLAAADAGLGACWVMLFDADKVREAVALPDHLFPVALVPVGYADQDPPPRPRYALGEIAFDESLDRPWGDA